jgi:pyridoxamine 5'-phosphate oxidase
MALATADAEGRPAVRMVLLKGFDERGFVFYTNLESRKGRELTANPHAALCLFWQPLELQVRIEGPVHPVSSAEADEYYASRARGSRIGAWASRQSQPLASYDELMARVQEYEARFAGDDIPRPPFWSGFRLDPGASSSGRAAPAACTSASGSIAMRPTRGGGRCRSCILELQGTGKRE